MDKEELSIIEELLNNEIEEMLNSGYGLQNEYVVKLREMLKKFNLREYYNYDTWK